MIQNFAALGYDSNNMHLAAYDWRLAFYNLEVRDSYFSKLKSNIELSKRTSNKKTVLVGHSMGLRITLFGFIIFFFIPLNSSSSFLSLSFFFFYCRYSGDAVFF